MAQARARCGQDSQGHSPHGEQPKSRHDESRGAVAVAAATSAGDHAGMPLGESGGGLRRSRHLQACSTNVLQSRYGCGDQPA